jgi:hypothetical protein
MVTMGGVIKNVYYINGFSLVVAICTNSPKASPLPRAFGLNCLSVRARLGLLRNKPVRAPLF